MATDSNRSIFAKDRLEMSEFMARELLYEYVVGSLDSQRVKKVEEIIERSEESRHEMERLAEGLEYCQSLSGSHISEDLLSHLSESQSVWKSLGNVFHFREWPDPVKWSVEGLLIAVVVGVIIANVPMERFFDLTKSEDPMLLAKIEHPPVDRQGDPGEMKATPPEPEQPLAVATTEETSTKPVMEATPAPTVAPTPKPQPKKLAEAPSTEPPKVAPSRPQPAGADGGNAFVYRLYMFRKNVEAINSDVVADIEGLGGEKAGQVELGWKKEKGRYFHFTIPSDGHDDLIDKLKNYGSVRIRKSKHSRVMPLGTYRYILWIEETGP